MAVLTNLRRSHSVKMTSHPVAPAPLIIADRCRFSVSAVPGGDDLLWSADHLQH